MQELARHPIAQHFKFLFVGGGWTDVIRELDSRQITVEHHDDANYQAYPGLYDRCDYLLIPSLWEGGPMSLIEAYAKGLPIISSDVGSVPDFGVDYLYPTGNLEALAKILDSLLEPARQRRAKVESLSYKKYADDICALVERIKNNMVKLNLGCGNDYREGWINVDSGNCRADIHFDIAQANWKIESDSVDYVVANHIVEHIDRDQIFTFLKELYRVCRHGAEIHIIAPYAGSDNFWTDPTHRFPMTLRTFDFFDKQKALSENGKIYGWDAVDFTVVEANYLPNPPNGPDLKYLLRVNKPTQS